MTSPLSPPGSVRAAAHTDPSVGGQHLPLDYAGSGVGTVGSAVASANADTSTTSATAPASPQFQRPVTWLQKGITKPKVYTDGTVGWGMLAKLSAEEPTSVDEALGDSKWVKAMDAEHQALLRNKTWRLVPRPQGKNIIGCKWV